MTELWRGVKNKIRTVTNARSRDGHGAYDDIQANSADHDLPENFSRTSSKSMLSGSDEDGELDFDPRPTRVSPSSSRRSHTPNPFESAPQQQTSPQFVDPFSSPQQSQSQIYPQSGGASPPSSNVFDPFSNPRQPNYNQTYQSPQQNFPPSQSPSSPRQNFQPSQGQYSAPQPNYQIPQTSYQSQPANYQQVQSSNHSSSFDDLFNAPIRQTPTSQPPNFIDFGSTGQASNQYSAPPPQFNNFSNSSSHPPSSNTINQPKSNIYGEFGDLAEFDLKGGQPRDYGKATTPRGFSAHVQ